jgi:RNA polymerase sigma factor (sigma-70 family)
MSSSKKYNVGSNLRLLHAIHNSVPDYNYRNLSDKELCVLVKDEVHRSNVRYELLRRHAPLIGSHVVNFFNRGVGGADLADYESLAVAIALQSYDDYDCDSLSLPSSYMYGLVMRRMIDAQRRTSIECDCRWPARKSKFVAWLNGDYDKYPELREKFERMHGVDESDRSRMRLLHGHLLNGTSGFAVTPYSLDAPCSTRTGSDVNYAFLDDSSADTSDSIINRVLFNDALANLSSDLDRNIFHLFAVEGLSLVEISKELNVSLSKVRNCFKRAQKHLQAVFA